MNKTTSDGANAAAGIDLRQFHPVFFEEASENLARMEQLLLDLDIASADDETLNAIFRCAHSVKGGAATFGFADVAELTHQMETLLDRLRRHELARDGGHGRRAAAGRRCAEGAAGAAPGYRRQTPSTPRRWCSSCAAWPGSTPACARHRRRRCRRLARGTCPRLPPRCRGGWNCASGRCPSPAPSTACCRLFTEIPDLGTSRRSMRTRAPANGMRRFKLATTSSDDELRDLFSFHVDGSSDPAGAAGATSRSAACRTRGDAERNAAGRRIEHAARVGGQGRPAHQPGRRARHHPGHAGAARRRARPARCSGSWPPASPTWSATRASCRKR